MTVQTKNQPAIKCLAGNEKMPDEHLVDNIDTIYKGILQVLPNAENSVKDISIKLTMGKPIKVESHVEEEEKK